MNLRARPVSQTHSIRQRPDASVLIGEKEHLERNFERDQGPEDLGPSHEADCPLEALNLVLVLDLELSGEEVGPEMFACTE